MKLYVLPALCCVILMFAFSSCTTPNEPGSPIPNEKNDDPCSLATSLPLQTGNWWVYSTYKTDQDDNKLPGSDGIDSTVVAGTCVVQGMTAYMLVTYRSQDQFITYTLDTSYYALSGGKGMVLFSSIVGDTVYPYIDHNQWLTFGDACGSTPWAWFDTTWQHTNSLLDGVIFSINVNISGYRSSTKEISVGAQMITATEYGIHFKEIGTILSPDDFTYPTGSKQQGQEAKFQLWLAPNIGPVRYVLPEVYGYHTNHHGFLLRYSIK